jgi:transcriptional regulator with XRE-family HTH domain
MSRRDVAQALGVTRHAVDSWESGRRRPDVERLGWLADLLGVTVTTFYRRPGGPGA